jgi:hypothetical protein
LAINLTKDIESNIFESIAPVHPTEADVMYQRKILQTSIVLILVLTLACGLIPDPLETSVPPSPTPLRQLVETLHPETPTPKTATTQDTPLVQIGYFNSIYLRYDPDEWEIFNEFQGQQLNNTSDPMESLRYRAIPGCFLHDNLGKGAPPSWELQDTKRIIGSLEYRVETWTDTATQKPVLIVYQYPVGEPGYGTRIELVIDQEPEQCIKSAEDTLILSSDIISKSP